MTEELKQAADEIDFLAAIKDATFISIDGFMFRVEGWYEDELHFENEENGEVHVNTKEELIDDMFDIKVYTLKETWG